MVEKKPLFMGDSEIDQIFKIFQFHGTPTVSDWPAMSELPDFKPTFPKFKGVDPSIYFKNFDKNGLDLVCKMIALDPVKRISVKEALNHPYFSDITREEIERF